MGDNGFDFRRVGERREPRQFEPPPWEKDAFEDLRRAQTEPQTEDEGVAEERPVEMRPAVPPVKAPESEPIEGREPAQDSKLDEARMLEMLAGLAAEEPSASRALFGISLGAAVFLSALGGVLIVWSVAALLGSRATGLFGMIAGAVLGLAGVGFLGGGLYLGVKTLKRRGVL